MAYPTRFYRLYNFLADQLAGLDFNNAKLDAELNAIQTTVDQINTTLRGITTSDGRLTNVASATALALAGSQRFVATASQTQFNTTITWDSTFTASSVVCFAGGSRIDSNSVTVANNAGFLRVTLSAQALSTVVIINAYAPGTVGADAKDVAVADTSAFYAATNVETVLAEIQNHATYGIRTLIAALPGGAISGLASYLKKDGTVTMTGSLNMGGGSAGSYVSANGQKIVGLKGGSANGDAVEWSQFTAFTTVWNNLATYFLKLDGTSTMAGALNMGNQKATSLADGTADQDAVNVRTARSLIASNGGLPPGAIVDFGGAAAPTGWLICDGTEVSQTTYAALFSVVGSTYGAAGAGLFKLPDLRGRVSVGMGTGSGLTARALAATGGGETHTLTIPEIPAHDHTITGYVGGGGATFSSGSGPFWYLNPNTGSTGGGGAHANMQPFTVLNKIIKW